MAKRGILLMSAEIFNPKRKLLHLAVRGNKWGRPQGAMSRNWREREGDERENEIRGEHLVELSQSVEPEKSQLHDYIDDGWLMLADGKSIPVAIGICDKHRLVANDQDLPICDGYVGGHKVRVLRDSGGSSATVRRDLITHKSTNWQRTCLPSDRWNDQTVPLGKHLCRYNLFHRGSRGYVYEKASIRYCDRQYLRCKIKAC